MALPEALTAIRESLGGTVVGRPDVTNVGNVPSAAVYQSDVYVNIHREEAYEVTVAFVIPVTHEYVSEDDIVAIQQKVRDFLLWLFGQARIGGLKLWISRRPATGFDYSQDATGTVAFWLAEEYPRA